MYKYKLKELEVGDVDITRGKKSTVSSVDDLTGAIEWDIIDVADFTSTFKTLLKAKDFLAAFETTGKTKDDKVIDGFSKQMTNLFNEFRTHIRTNYPEEYKRVKNLKESITESKGAKNYFDDLIFNYQKAFRYLESDEKKEYQRLAKNYFSKLKESVNEGHGLDQVDLDYLQFIADKNPDDTKLKKIVKFLSKSNILVDKTKDLSKGKEVEEGEGIGYLTPNAFGKNKKDVYTSQYGYKLVPKKIKGSGLEVKQLFQESTTDVGKHQLERIEAFDRLESEVENILPLISNAKTETEEYYANKPKSYAVVYSTDAVFELLKDIKSYLTNNPE